MVFWYVVIRFAIVCSWRFARWLVVSPDWSKLLDPGDWVVELVRHVVYLLFIAAIYWLLGVSHGL